MKSIFLSLLLNSLGSSKSLISFGSLFQSWLALKANDFQYSSVLTLGTITLFLARVLTLPVRVCVLTVLYITNIYVYVGLTKLLIIALAKFPNTYGIYHMDLNLWD